MSTDQEIINDICNLSIDGNWRTYVKEFEYLGFNPIQFYRHLLTIESRSAQLKVDMGVVLLFIMKRGPNINHHLRKSKKEAKDRLQPIVDKYKIVDNVPAIGSPDVVTGGRIMGTFPVLCFDLARNGVFKDPTNYKGDLPDHFKFMSAPALFDSDETYNEWLKWAIEFDKVVNTKTGRADEQNVRRFSEIVFRTTYFKRKHLMI